MMILFPFVFYVSLINSRRHHYSVFYLDRSHDLIALRNRLLYPHLERCSVLVAYTRDIALPEIHDRALYAVLLEIFGDPVRDIPLCDSAEIHLTLPGPHRHFVAVYLNLPVINIFHCGGEFLACRRFGRP